MDYHGALGALRTIVKERPDAILVNEGANTLDLARGIIDMYQPRKRLDVGTWGVMGIGMGFAIAAAIETGKPVLAVEGDSAFGFSGMEVETICRYNLPVCVVIFNNDGIYRGTDVNPAGGSDPATTVFVKGSRYDKMMEAFGGVGVNATTPDELKRAVNEAMDSGKPTLINAVIDPAAGSESGRIGNLNPQSALRRRNRSREVKLQLQCVARANAHPGTKLRDQWSDSEDGQEAKRRRPRQGRRKPRQKSPPVKSASKARREEAGKPQQRRIGNGLPKPSTKPSGRPARRSTACASSTSPTCSRARPARSFSATWAPTASRSSGPASATSRAASCAT